MDSGFLIKFLCFCAAEWFSGCEGRMSAQRCLTAAGHGHTDLFFWASQHHVHVVKLKPKCAAVCFPLCRERPQRQIFNESREAGVFHLSVKLKQNQVNCHNSLSEAMVEGKVVAAPVTLMCASACISSLGSTSPWYVSCKLNYWSNQSLLLYSMGGREKVPRVRE